MDMKLTNAVCVKLVEVYKTACQKTDYVMNWIIMKVPLVPVFMQSMPSREFFSTIWRDLMSANVWIGGWPLFSASAIGIDSSASANALIAYCSNVATYS